MGDDGKERSLKQQRTRETSREGVWRGAGVGVLRREHVPSAAGYFYAGRASGKGTGGLDHTRRYHPEPSHRSRSSAATRQHRPAPPDSVPATRPPSATPPSLGLVPRPPARPPARAKSRPSETTTRRRARPHARLHLSRQPALSVSPPRDATTQRACARGRAVVAVPRRLSHAETPPCLFTMTSARNARRSDSVPGACGSAIETSLSPRAHACETDPPAACRPTPRPRVGGKEFWTANGCCKGSTIPPPASLGTMGTIAKLGGSATLRRQSAQCHRQRLWPHTQSPANLLFSVSN